MVIEDVLNFILGLPKTIYFNFKYFKFRDAIKLPVILSKNVWLLKTSGEIEINSKIKTGMIKIGFSNVGIFDRIKQRTIWEVSGKIAFGNNIFIGAGSKISVQGLLVLNTNFKITANSTIFCTKSIEFGTDCLVSWENLIMDTDSHKIIDTNKEVVNKDKEIIIGDRNWIGCRCTILKGTKIGNNNVIATNTVINKEILVSNCLLGGVTAKIIKENIEWEK